MKHLFGAPSGSLHASYASMRPMVGGPIRWEASFDVTQDRLLGGSAL